jgi:hypothetical protein
MGMGSSQRPVVSSQLAKERPKNNFPLFAISVDPQFWTRLSMECQKRKDAKPQRRKEEKEE